MWPSGSNSPGTRCCAGAADKSNTMVGSWWPRLPQAVVNAVGQALQAGLAPDETVNLLHPPLPLVAVSSDGERASAE